MCGHIGPLSGENAHKVSFGPQSVILHTMCVNSEWTNKMSETCVLWIKWVNGVNVWYDWNRVKTSGFYDTKCERNVKENLSLFIWLQINCQKIFHFLTFQPILGAISGHFNPKTTWNRVILTEIRPFHAKSAAFSNDFGHHTAHMWPLSGSCGPNSSPSGK